MITDDEKDKEIAGNYTGKNLKFDPEEVENNPSHPVNINNALHSNSSLIVMDSNRTLKLRNPYQAGE